MKKKKLIIILLIIFMMIGAGSVYVVYKYWYLKWSSFVPAMIGEGGGKDWWKNLDSRFEMEVPNLTKAKEEANFNPRVPKETLKGNLIKIIISKDKVSEKGKKELYLIHNNGLEIGEQPDYLPEGKPPLSYKEGVASDKESREKGFSHATTPFFLVYVKGMEGMASEPGFNVFGEEKIPYSGSVEWCDNKEGVRYWVNGWDIPVSQLLKVAESMYE